MSHEGHPRRVLTTGTQAAFDWALGQNRSKRTLERDQKRATLAANRTKFDAFITVDRGVEHQQKTTSVKLGIVILEAPDNSLPTLAPLVPEVLSVLNRIRPGQVIRVPERKD